jgi:dipeptidyl aminopeptidase/acylaminoacyl peptidase
MPKNNESNGLFKPEDFLKLRNVSDPQLSPDGKRLAYVVSSPDKDSDEVQTAIYTVDADGKSKPERFTQGTKDSAPRWSPDGRSLAFISKRGDDEPQLFLMPLDGGESEPLTKAKFGVSQPVWSPDGKRIAYVTRTGKFTPPKERKGAEKNAPRVIRNLRYRFDGVGYYDERRPHVFTLDVESRKETQITNGDYEDAQPAWSPNGKLIAFVSDRERDRFDRFWSSDIWVVPSNAGKPRKLTRSLGRSGSPSFSPDGRLIAYIGHEHGIAGSAKNSHLFVVPVAGGKAPQSLSAPLDRSPIGELSGATGKPFTWSRDGKSILFLVGDSGANSLYRAGLANGSISKVLGGDRQITGIALSTDQRTAYFTSIWTSTPPELYATSLGGSGRDRALKERTLSHANDDIDVVATKRVTYKASDGLEIEAFVQYPPRYKAGRRYPLALLIHGGPHAQHPMPTLGWLAIHQSLAAAGYVVLAPNPRGSASYGEDFAMGCVEDWGGMDYEDLMTGVDVMIERGIADPERLFVTGRSYGGFMSTWVVGHSDRFRAAVITATVSDLVSKFGTADITSWYPYEIGGTPWENHDEYAFRSPISYLPNVTTPVLLTHSEGDLRCPIGQSEEIFATLKMLGKEVEFVRYPGGFHGVRTPSQEVDQTTRIIDWFAKHTPRSRSASKRKTARKKVAVSANGRRNGRARAANGRATVRRGAKKSSRA